MTCIKILFYN